MLATVAIVGRPNVGKSTIFNRFIGDRKSIVENQPGVTRDRLYGKAEWLTKTFHVVDTGGIELRDESLLHSIRAQAELAIDEADVILFLVDGQAGITASDRDVAELLYRSQKPVVLAVNKIDHSNHEDAIYEFYELGFGDPVGISGAHGIGMGDVLDRLVEHFPDEEDDIYDEEVIRIAVIGRPNVGKSSLVNAVLGEDRVIVSDIAGTTRDAIDTPFVRENQNYVIIDTAGMRKRGKVYENIEKYSVMRAIKAIDRADVALLVLDGFTGIIEQDKHIAGYALDAGKAIVIIVNKWDITEKDERTTQELSELIRSEFAFIRFAPILFVSALTKQRVHKILPAVQEVADMHAMRVQTSVLNDLLLDATLMNIPPSDKGKRLRIYYGTQASVKPPTFILFVNDPDLMHFSYQRYLENQLREAFGFQGTPIRVFTKRKAGSTNE